MRFYDAPPLRYTRPNFSHMSWSDNDRDFIENEAVAPNLILNAFERVDFTFDFVCMKLAVNNSYVGACSGTVKLIKNHSRLITSEMFGQRLAQHASDVRIAKSADCFPLCLPKHCVNLTVGYTVVRHLLSPDK